MLCDSVFLHLSVVLADPWETSGSTTPNEFFLLKLVSYFDLNWQDLVSLVDYFFWKQYFTLASILTILDFSLLKLMLYHDFNWQDLVNLVDDVFGNNGPAKPQQSEAKTQPPVPDVSVIDVSLLVKFKVCQWGYTFGTIKIIKVPYTCIQYSILH